MGFTLKRMATHVVHSASTGMSPIHLVTRRVGFFTEEVFHKDAGLAICGNFVGGGDAGTHPIFAKDAKKGWGTPTVLER